MKKIFQVLVDYKWTVMVVALILGGGGYYFYNQKTADTTENQVKTAVVKKGDVEIVVNGSGQIQAESQVDLKPQVAGDGLDVVEVLVSNDQVVKKDQLIAVLDSETANENVRDAELALRSAEIQYKETAKEFDNLTVEETWKRDSAQIVVQQKIHALNDAKKELEDYRIKAPFDGIVTGLSVEAGDSISRDDILASVITEKMQAEITLNEIDAAKIKKNDSAVLIFDILEGQEISGQVAKIDTIGEVNSGVVSYNVVVSFDFSSEILKPGMSVEVDIKVNSVQDVLIIPVSAIQEDQNGKEYVMVVSEGTETATEFVKKSVGTGLTDDVYIEIISGLEEGDEVVTQALSTAQSTGGTDSDEAESKSLFQMGGGRGPR